LLLTGIVMSSDGNTARPVPRILIANDQEWTARSLESILSAEGYEVIRAFTGRQALERALDARPDLIVLDTQLPDISGPEVCRQLRAHPVVGWVVPIILTTAGSNGRNRMVEAMESGAWDFATQPFDGPLLLARIRTYLQAKAAHDAALAEATLDHGTGAYNRRGLSLRLSELWADARRRREPMTCLVVSAEAPELTLALQQAETLAARLVAALRDSVRSTDAVARLAPLEFAILAPSLGREAAVRVIERFRPRLTAALDGSHITLRTGIATIEVEDGATPEQLLHNATAAVAWSNAARPAVA
jgi:PleD family two-component response regulator